MNIHYLISNEEYAMTGIKLTALKVLYSAIQLSQLDDLQLDRRRIE